VREIEEEIVELQRRECIESQNFLRLLRAQKAEIEDDLLALGVASGDDEIPPGGAKLTAKEVKERKTMLNGKQCVSDHSLAIHY
jgi:hypothetical protein